MEPTERLLVACLCAAWCGTCREYEAAFAAARQADGGAADWAWVDIEDHDEVLGALDVENFPTLLIARGDAVLFYGTVTPHLGTLQRLLQNARDGDFSPSADPQVAGLPARVRAVDA